MKAFTLHLSGYETNKLALFFLIAECMEAGFTDGLKKKILYFDSQSHDGNFNFFRINPSSPPPLV